LDAVLGKSCSRYLVNGPNKNREETEKSMDKRKRQVGGNLGEKRKAFQMNIFINRIMRECAGKIKRPIRVSSGGRGMLVSRKALIRIPLSTDGLQSVLLAQPEGRGCL